MDSPGGCPPAAPTPAHRLPGLPHISTASGLTAAISATTLIFFQPLLRANALRASLAPFVARPDGRGSRRSRGNPVGVPRGVEGEPEGLTGGRHAPAPRGVDHPPLGGCWRGRGSRPKGGGTPSGGAPRSASSRRSYRYKEANFWRKPRILFIINDLRSIFGFSYVHPRVNIYVHPRSEHSALWRT